MKLNTRKSNLKKVTTLVVISGVAMVILAISLLLYALPQATAAWTYFVFILIYSSLLTVSLTQILVFHRPDIQFSTDSNSGSNNKVDLPKLERGTNDTTTEAVTSSTESSDPNSHKALIESSSEPILTNN